MSPTPIPSAASVNVASVNAYYWLTQRGREIMCAVAPRQEVSAVSTHIRSWKGKPTLSERCVAGIDIGGTKLALAVATHDGRTLEAARFPTRVEQGPRAILERVFTELEAMRERNGARIAAIGIGCGGPLDRV